MSEGGKVTHFFDNVYVKLNLFRRLIKYDVIKTYEEYEDLILDGA